MTRVRFSAIICAYNSAGMLRDALRSLAAQTFSDFEAMVVDDGSTDNSEQVAGEFKSSFRHFCYLKKAHAGIADSRNVGIQKASGDYIAFLDADDLWSPDYLAAISAALERHPEAELVYTNGFRFEPPNRILGPFFDDGPSLCGPIRSSQELYSCLRSAGASATVIAKPAFKRIGLYDVRFPLHGEDWDWLSRAAAQGTCRLRLNEKLLVYRVHGRNLSASTDKVFAAWLEIHASTFKRLSLDSKLESRARRFTRRMVPFLLARYPPRQVRSLLSRACREFPGDPVLKAAYLSTYFGAQFLMKILLALRNSLRRLLQGEDRTDWRIAVNAILRGSSLLPLADGSKSGNRITQG